MINIPKFHSLAWMSTCAALVGCVHNSKCSLGASIASQTGDVGVDDISAFGAASVRLVLRENETIFLPRPAASNPLPTYPHSLLAQRLPAQVVCLHIGVGTNGEVMTALPMALATECRVGATTLQAAGDRRFFDAARDAVLQWRFDAAFRCEYPHDAARIRGDCSGGRETPQASSLAYRFIFEQRDGRGSVRHSDTAE